MINDIDELDRLISNMGEKEIVNLLSILKLYVTERSLNEIELRVQTEEFNPSFEWKMRGVMDFKKFMEERLKEQY